MKVAPLPRRLSLAAVLVLAASPLAAAVWIVPGAANVAGVNGTRFLTRVTLVNSGNADRKVSLGLIPGPGTISPADRSYTIAAGSTLVFENVLDAAWSLQGTGALRISTDGDVAVFARIANSPSLITIPENPPAAYSSSLPVFGPERLLAAGQSGHSAWAPQSADPGTGQRTNVAVAFPDEGGGAAAVSVFDSKGSLLAAFVLESREPAFLQKSLASLLPGASASARVTVAVTRGRACAYTGAIDNVTGDLSVFPADPIPEGPTAVIGNGAVLAPGAGGGVWRTEVHIANPTDRAVTANAIFPGVPDASVDVFAVAAGGTLVIPDVVSSKFHAAPPVAGAVLWVADGPLLIQTRTRTESFPPFAGGTVGAAQRAIPVAAFQAAGDPPADLADVGAGIFARTNLLFAAGPEGATVTIEAFEYAGASLGSVRRSLGSFRFAEFPLTGLFTIPSTVTRLRLKVRVEAGDANVQAAVVDGLTGDPMISETFPPPPAPRLMNPLVKPGVWGRADGLEGLKADAATLFVDRYCRKGFFPQPSRLDAQGKFVVVGFYNVNIGPAQTFNAVLYGFLSGDTLTITTFAADDGRSLDSPAIFLYGRPYSIGPEVCPIEY